VLEVVNSNLTSEREEFIQRLVKRLATAEREMGLTERERDELRMAVNKKDEALAQTTEVLAQTNAQIEEADSCIQRLREEQSGVEKELLAEKHRSEGLSEQLLSWKGEEREQRERCQCVR
jgi:chromosome segregation ATPase